MKRKLFILITGFLILFPGTGFSQKYHTNSSRALRAYDQGKQEYDFFFFDKAEASLKDAIQADNRFYEAYMLLGEMMYKLKHYKESAQYYQQAVKIDSLFYRPVFF